MTGLCECGCGQATPLAIQTRTERGQIKGQPLRFINGHNARLPRSEEHKANVAAALRGTKREQVSGERAPSWKGDEASSSAIHKWVNAHFPRAGVCEDCGRDARTHWAFRHHPHPHTRNREDYRELCNGCHRRFDGYTKEGGFHNGGWAKRRVA